MPKLTVKVDPDLCIGAASCVTVDPSTFQMNDENKAYVLDHGAPAPVPDPTRVYERVLEVTEDEKETIILAAQSCPTLAIFIYDEAGTQLFPEM